MTETTYTRVRSAAKAIIVEDGQLLTVKNQHKDSIYYTLPGGGQKPGETLAEAMARECLEEVGVKVIVHDCLLIREYLSKNHEFAEMSRPHHQVDCCFRVEMLPGEVPGEGIEPDTEQIGVAWLPIASLAECALYPKAFREIIPQALNGGSRVYLGDLN